MAAQLKVAELEVIFAALPHGALHALLRLAKVIVPALVTPVQVTDPFAVVPTPEPLWLSHRQVEKLKCAKVTSEGFITYGKEPQPLVGLHPTVTSTRKPPVLKLQYS